MPDTPHEGLHFGGSVFGSTALDFLNDPATDHHSVGQRSNLRCSCAIADTETDPDRHAYTLTNRRNTTGDLVQTSCWPR